ncbi:MAG TPA: hypothetical protein VHF27_11105 [Acidimicrobiales bacterium]|nr:hypothetical protein [Acidimicrobiales bacterium]
MAPKAGNRGDATRSDRRRAAVHRRRRLAAARSNAARRAVRRTRRLRALAVVATLAVVGGTVTYLVSRPAPEPSRELRAEPVPGAVGTLGITTTPASYRVVYSAESYDGPKVTRTTEEVEIRRPFDGRVFIRDGEPPGGAVRFQGRSTFALYANYAESGAAQVAGNAPTVALGDLRLAASLDELVARGLFVLGDRRRALGRECQVYRTGSPLQSLEISAPTESDYADVCLTDAGLILEEVTVAGGKLSQRLTTTELEIDPTFELDAFTIEGARVGPDQGGVEVTEVDRGVAPAAGYWALGAPPAGFTHQGRYLVQAAEGPSHVDAYVRGTDLLTVRQGVPAAEPDLTGAGEGRGADLGPLGQGTVVISSIGTTVVAHPGAEAFVHVSGTIAPAELQALATSLRRS